MRSLESQIHRGAAAGFTLPVVLVVVAAMLVMAVGILLVSGVERSTARSFVDHQRADLAADAGLEEIRNIFKLEAANDDFVILQSALTSPITEGREPAPQLFLARAKADGGDYLYRYVPLFSALGLPDQNAQLTPPAIEPLLGSDTNERIDFPSAAYQDKVRAAWRTIEDENGRTVARYAYVVEDLQGKLDPRQVGNLDGPNSTHARSSAPFPAPGLNPSPESDAEHPLDEIALFAVDPDTFSDSQGKLAKNLVENRPLLVSPGSMLAAAKIEPPLIRDGLGHLKDSLARAAEENLAPNLQSYLERPLIPHAPGIKPTSAGAPRMNLNALLAKNPDTAVDEMAAFIRAALPDFDGRKGGFPEDYVKTLAANAIDYADADSHSTLKPDQYRGIDVFPLLSEIALQVNYVGISNVNDRKIMTFRFKLFVELFNPTSQPTAGVARLSYEVALPMSSIGAGIENDPFDSPSMLSNPAISSHDLTLIDGRYWTHEVNVSLEPNQYRCDLFADVTYRMDVGAASDIIPDETPFSLDEMKGASGLSLMWGGQVIERIPSILRQAGLLYSKVNGVVTGGFKVGTSKTITKAALPGHVYDDYPSMYYNMGDPRITHYLRSAQLDENAYPENSSPNRRNIRLEIYKNDTPNKPKVYARMLPSEWPDCGHNAAVGTWGPGSNDKTEMTESKFNFPYDPQMRLAAPQQISNRGRFYSTTELGRIFDPVMHAPTFSGSGETADFRRNGKMPPSRSVWPDVNGNHPSPFYGGGNTLRIGRPEHPEFDLSAKPGMHAARLLDLFHVGQSRSTNPAAREGSMTRIAGHVNLNTATRDVLRAMAGGTLVMDSLLANQTDNNHLDAPSMAPPASSLTLSAPTLSAEADRIADAIIHSRPYVSAADLARARGSDGTCVFGERTMYPETDHIEWSDAAAEEIFARVYESSTVRSRNFRVWIVAQSLAPSIMAGHAPTVLAEVRKVFTLFADPGERAADGAIIQDQFKTKVTYSNDF